MKLADINPSYSGYGKPFKDGKTRRVGNWSFYDCFRDGYMTRVISHRGTVMGEFDSLTGFEWGFSPVSTGWGSVSDQNGMNKIMPSRWRFRRNGGNPRYELNGEIHEV